MSDLLSVDAINRFIAREKNWRFLLAAIKGLRNGFIYGCRIRAPHALVMVFLWGSGSVRDKLWRILSLTRTHASNLARFAVSYKLLTGLLAKAAGARAPWHSAAAAAFVGYHVFGQYNAVNMQINLYLMSRIVVALARLSIEKGLVPQPTFPVFPWLRPSREEERMQRFGAAMWGLVLWLFEWHGHTLQPSLQSSMKYIYADAEEFSSLRDLLLVNKLPRQSSAS